MDIGAAHAALLEQPACRFDHDRRAREVSLATIELVEVLGERLVHQAEAAFFAAATSACAADTCARCTSSSSGVIARWASSGSIRRYCDCASASADWAFSTAARAASRAIR